MLLRHEVLAAGPYLPEGKLECSTTYHARFSQRGFALPTLTLWGHISMKDSWKYGLSGLRREGPPDGGVI